MCTNLLKAIHSETAYDEVHEFTSTFALDNEVISTSAESNPSVFSVTNILPLKDILHITREYILGRNHINAVNVINVLL